MILPPPPLPWAPDSITTLPLGSELVASARPGTEVSRWGPPSRCGECGPCLGLGLLGTSTSVTITCVVSLILKAATVCAKCQAQLRVHWLFASTQHTEGETEAQGWSQS